MNIAIVGDGGWGTALGLVLSRKKNKVKIWGAFPNYVRRMVKSRENRKFLPGIFLPKGILISSDLEFVLNNSRVIILAVPSLYMRSVVKKMKKIDFSNASLLSVAKGLEHKTEKRMSVVIKEELGDVPLAVLSGPNIAYEVARGVPSACVCASKKLDAANLFQDALMTRSFRVYTSDDVCGVELAGALKNIIAIACGISDGLGFGTNTKAALLTRGLVEISRLGVALGAKHKTFIGLSGMGDLITTCYSQKSRNRWLGEQIGRGKSLPETLKSTEMVIEGVMTANSAFKLAKRLKVSLPITQEVYSVLFLKKSPKQALRSLMSRQKKKEL